MNRSSSQRKAEESSVLFSLNELLDLESERISEERAKEEMRQAAEEAERAARAEEQRQREEARLEAQREARRREEFERRSEEARLDAIRVAEVERARRLTEDEARRRLIAQSQDHELKMAEIHEDRTKKVLRRSVVATGIVAVALALGGGYWFSVEKQRAEEARLVLQRETEQLRQERDRQITDLKREIERTSSSDKERIRTLQEKLEGLEKNTPSNGELVPQKGIPNSGTQNKPPKPRVEQVKPPSACQDGDPMCEELGR